MKTKIFVCVALTLSFALAGCGASDTANQSGPAAVSEEKALQKRTSRQLKVKAVRGKNLVPKLTLP